MKKEKRIQELLKKREEIKKKIEKVEAVFSEEKENEEFWPGHASTRYQMADAERHVLVESELKKLGHHDS